MKIDKANEANKLVIIIDKCVLILATLDSRSYPDEFTIHYRGMVSCELEEAALNILIEYYKKLLLETEKQLERL